MKLLISSIIFIIFSFSGCSHADQVPEERRNTARTYNCDYHTVSISTCISFEKDGSEYEITGNLFKVVTDPLQLSKDGTVIGKADDSYKLIGQDDHAIVINGKFEVDVYGNFELLGNSYELRDINGDKIGSASFGEMHLDGTVYDAAGEVIAEYSKLPLINDYDVTIYDNDVCSDEAILMIVASYVSDYHADE